jgi:cyclophilin family peptidyl-prolyl cis-trans isomerase/HEAT repeat protein
MKRTGIAALVSLLIIIVAAVFYFDFFNLKTSREDIIASIIEYEDTRRVSDKLIGYLKEPDSEVRALAALAVGRIGDGKGMEELFMLLRDSSEQVAEAAAFAIGLTDQNEYALRLMEEAADLEGKVLAGAVQSAGRLGDSSMTGLINDLIPYLVHSDPQVREQACHALWRSGGKTAASHLIGLAVDDPDRQVRVAALYSLVRLNIAEPVELYSEWVPDSDPFARTLAIRGLGLGKNDSKTFLAAVGLNDRDNNVVSQAVSSLTTIGTPKAISFLAARYENESDEKLKVQMLESFTRLRSDAIEAKAAADVDSAESVNIKAAGLVYLAQIRGGDALTLIDSLGLMKNRYIDVAIVRSLGEIGGEQVKPRLTVLFKDSIPEVRAAAFEELCKIDEVNLDYYLKTALEDGDFAVVVQAVDKIGQLKKRKYLPQLMSLMKDPESTPTDLKRGIASAMAEFLADNGRDSLPVNGPALDGAEDILYHCLLDKDYLVSRDAAEVYREKLGVDKKAFITKPSGLIGKREIKSFVTRYAGNPRAVISTNRGDIEIELYIKNAPLTIYNFMKLAKEQFYNNLTFHRVVPGFVIQGGDPRGDGWGGPGYAIRDEWSDIPFERGTVGIATSGKDSGGSQYFIMLGRAPHLDARYTLFGKVVAGMNVVDNIVRGDTITSIRLIEEKRK